jgi:hypothetical protein
MPLKKGHSSEVVSSNIKDLVRAGHEPKQAMAIALAAKRKSKMMADGGMIQEEGTVGEPVYPMDSDNQGLSPKTEAVSEENDDLQADKYSANDNTHSFEADDMVSGKKMSQGGLVQPETTGEKLGTKPDLAWINNGPEDTMSRADGMRGLSDEAKMALMAKKMKRRIPPTP